jgi:hypothetical protein
MVLWLLIVSALAQNETESPGVVCPIYTCKFLPYYRCVTIELPAIYLNPCGADMRCDYLEGFAATMAANQTEMLCYSNYEDTTILTVDTILADMDLECAKLAQYQTSGQLTVDRESFICTTDSECTLTNGAYTSCQCSGDGRARCLQGEGDEGYVTRAQAGCDKNNELFIIKAVEVKTGNTLIEAPDCLMTTFADFKWYSYLKDGGNISIFYDNYAAWVGISVLLVLGNL